MAIYIFSVQKIICSNYSERVAYLIDQIKLMVILMTGFVKIRY